MSELVPVPLRYRIARSVIHFMMQLYYRAIEIYGLDLFPRRGRTMIIANHQTGLLDGVSIIGTNRLMVRTMIKNTLWENYVIGFFANMLGMIPVYRKQDLKEGTAADPKRHEKTFSMVEEAFVAGQNALIFPEGRSHDEPYVLPLKSGAARILLQSEAHHDFRLGLKYMPVVIDFENKAGPGGRMLLHYHPPRGIEGYRDLYEQDPEAAVEKLRLEMNTYLHDITLSFRDWNERIFLEHLTEIWLAEAPARSYLDRHNQLLKWKRTLESSSELEVEHWAVLREKVERLIEQLKEWDLKPRDLFRKSKPQRRTLFFSLGPKVLFWGIPIVAGELFFYIPTKIIQGLTKIGARNQRDVISTYHFVLGIVILPLWIALSLVGFNSLLHSWALSIILAVTLVNSGIIRVVVPRRLRVEARTLLNLFRFGLTERHYDRYRVQVADVWRASARLWNSALRRQILIESASTKT